MILDATDLTTFEVAADGSRVRLNLLGADGREFAVILPVACATALLMTLPAIQKQALQAIHNDPSMRVVYPMQGWKLEGSDEPGCVILTLATADGFQVSFALDSNSILDMARALEDSQASLPVARTTLLQ